jgi:type IV pilus assembly protein PilV|tara:strand:+ start:154 stop:735 length:582 start_codon:yes stop_codon:yes gene_type:complete
MFNLNRSRPHTPKINPVHGFTLIEVLVTLVITAIALLGFVGLQNRAQMAELEASNRVHANLLAQHMVGQIKANPTLGNVCASFSSSSWTTSSTTTCPILSTWKSLIDGNNETIGAGTSSLKVGGITKGKGCITYAESSTPNGLIKPAMYKVEVAWQGVNKSADGGDADSCGYGGYGDDNGKHRLVSYDVYVSA